MFNVFYPTDRPAVIRYFYLKNPDTNLAINPYLTKLNRKVFNLNIFKNNPASLPITLIMIVFWTQYIYTISQCGIILISFTQRITNTIPFIGWKKPIIRGVGRIRLPTSRFLILSDLFIWRNTSCRLFLVSTSLVEVYQTSSFHT